jgi:peroxiredoxin Q/BCP
MKHSTSCLPYLFAATLSVGSVAETLGADTAKDSVELRVGATAPTFIAHDDEGKLFNVADHLGKKVVVLFFFPAALTGG